MGNISIPILIKDIHTNVVLKADWLNIIIPVSERAFTIKLPKNYKAIMNLNSIWEFQVPPTVNPFPKYGRVHRRKVKSDMLHVTFRLIYNNLELIEALHTYGD